MLWALSNQTPSTTNTVTWIPVNVTGATTITYPLYGNQTTPAMFNRIWREEHEQQWEPIRNEFVPYTPAIIRRLSDQHDREEFAAAEAAARQAMLERQEAARLAREVAGSRSRELLMSHLTPDQRNAFEQNKWFIVEGGRTKQKYKIHANGSLNANVEVIGKNHRLCAHCDHYSMPYNDHVLMQKVMLELDEDSFLRIANRHHG
jgi:hypothetical protein